VVGFDKSNGQGQREMVMKIEISHNCCEFFQQGWRDCLAAKGISHSDAVPIVLVPV
jgi:hypothetical protein